MPREGHMAEVLRIIAHLRKYHNTELVFEPSNPVVDELVSKQRDWTSSSTNKIYELRDGIFHVYKARQNRTTWYQASNHTQTDLPDDAVAHSTKKFG
eukprot:8940723-Ditylum_brightwellii.AAC.1